MSLREKYLQHNASGQMLIEFCLFLFDRITMSELQQLAELTKNSDIVSLTSQIGSLEITGCSRDGFLAYRYSALETVEFAKEEVFFEALQKQYFKDLCLGFYRYAKGHRKSYDWLWSENFQIVGSQLKMFVFSPEEIESNDLLKVIMNRVKLDEKWVNSEKLQQKIFLKGLSLEKLERIAFPTLQIQLIEEAFSYLYFQLKVPDNYIDYLSANFKLIQSEQNKQKLINTLLFKDRADILKKLIKENKNNEISLLSEAYLRFLSSDFESAQKFLQDYFQKISEKENTKKINFSLPYAILGYTLFYTKAELSSWENYWKPVGRDAIKNNYWPMSLAILSPYGKLEFLNDWNKTQDQIITKNSSLHSLLFIAYSSFWMGRSNLSKYISQLPIVQDIRTNNAWLDREFEILQFLSAQTLDEINLDGNLWKINAPVPEWELLLDQIFQVTNEMEESGNYTGGMDRIIWRFNPENYFIEAILQKYNPKTNQWSKGRNISWNRIQDNEIYHAMTAQDHLIKTRYIQLAEASKQGSQKEVELLADYLESLVDHPQLVLNNSHESNLQIVKVEPEIELLSDEKGYYFDILHKESYILHQFLFRRETSTRYAFIKLNKEQQTIFQLLEKKRFYIPFRAEEKLIQALKPLSKLITIHSSLNPEFENWVKLESSTVLFAQIIPQQDAFTLEFFIKPLGDMPPYVSPGRGNSTLFAQKKGISYQVIRNLELEKQILDDLIYHCPKLQETVVENQIHLIENANQCLQILQEFDSYRKDEKLIIEWPQGEKLRVRHHVSFDHLLIKVKTNNDWFELDGQVTVNDDLVLSIQEILQRTEKSDNRFIALDDGSFLALTDQLYKKLKELESVVIQDKDQLKINKWMALSLQEFENFNSLEADEKWFEFIQKLDQINKLEFEIPEQLNAKLRPYQIEGYQWLGRMSQWGAGACLADDMGLGKTVQTIALIISRAELGPTLVVAPASVCSNWVSELQKFAPHLKSIHLSHEVDRDIAIQSITKQEVLVITYGLLHQCSEMLNEKRFSTIVLDEAQSIKNRLTKRSQAAMDLKADFKVITTGTPIENHLGELWNLFHFTNPGLLGTASQFQERFAIPIEKYNQVDKRKHLQKLIQPFVLRRLKKDVLKDLPDKTEITLTIERTEEEASFYEALRNNAIQKIQGNHVKNEGQKQIMVLAELMRLRRACCHPSLVEGGNGIASSKLEALSELIDELIENGHKALIFSQFVDYLKIIERLIISKSLSYQYLDGSTSLKKRKESVEAFQNGEGQVFLISLKAGGTGLNLTAADYVIHVDPWWNPAVEDQASDRAHRIGQQNPVTVYRLVSEGSIEQKIVTLHDQKRELAEALLADTHGNVKMNSSDLIALLRND